MERTPCNMQQPGQYRPLSWFPASLRHTRFLPVSNLQVSITFMSRYVSIYVSPIRDVK
jgi:hypothetical protein